MPTIFVDPNDGLLAVKDAYNDRNLCQSAGCFWDAETKLWKMVFTLKTFETLLKKIPHAFIDPAMKGQLEEQKKKEDKLAEIRRIAKDNEDINFRVMGLNATLFPYQKLGILYSTVNRNSMLIADSMGLGKSIQGLATALVLKNKGLAKQCLVVTPASLKYNWPLEVAKFTNEKCIVVDGKKPEDRIAQWLDTSAFFKIVNYELVVEDLFGGREYKPQEAKTPEELQKQKEKVAKKNMRQRLLSDIKKKVWDVCICDEAHMLKHTDSKRHRAIKAVKCKTRIFLTGTPMDGRLEELFNLMSILAPGILGSRTSFYNRHVVTDFFGSIKGYKNIPEVQEKIAPFFIRRLKSDVLKQLPDKIYENRVISLSEEEKKIYQAIKKGKHDSVKEAEAVVRAIRCKQFCNFPQMLDPNCKSSSKLDAFRDVLEEVIQLNGNKAVIFSQYKEMLNVLVKVLDEMHLKYLRIDGDTDKKLRADYQKRFNEDNTIDCIIGTEAMSTGLNLIGANHVINYDDNWQPAIMAQRQDRCHRIGQKDTVTCISFVCKDTIEEHIRSVLYTKDKVTSETLGDGTDEAVLKKLGPKELEDLM